MAVNVPDLTGDATTPGLRGGVTGSPPVKPTTSVAVAATASTAPAKLLQTRWRPESLLDFHRQLASNPEQAARSLDKAVQQAYQNDSTLESMIACTQYGKTVVTGSQTSIATGLLTVTAVTAVIDNGAVAHNFWVSAVISKQPGCIDLYIWMPTNAATNTPIACTSAVTVRWSVRGTLS